MTICLDYWRIYTTIGLGELINFIAANDVLWDKDTHTHNWCHGEITATFWNKTVNIPSSIRFPKKHTLACQHSTNMSFSNFTIHLVRNGQFGVQHSIKWYTWLCLAWRCTSAFVVSHINLLRFTNRYLIGSEIWHNCSDIRKLTLWFYYLWRKKTWKPMLFILHKISLFSSYYVKPIFQMRLL